ncbi:leucine-rich repeat protein [Flavobacterium piscis]|uniref:Repeat protein (TIGR01451 family) n=1 Tax=Flavobacterium piscis TaxID=1114874 RepID=A0ABU1Y9K1_9FLAO|nr:leucine-rich repeat protein [Flavobacterium piscis]MDR7210900.1 putative repeat protein (TIGR01451 family) [Flavobacterium piscis]
MEFNFKKCIFLILASLLLSCSNDDDIDPANTADLSIVVAASTNSPIANTNLTFTLIATNRGPLNATDVIVENEIFSGYIFVSAESSLGSYNDETGIWIIGDLENGATAMLIIKVKVNETGEYNNKATISGEQTDIMMANNVLTSMISLKPLTNDLLFTYKISEGSNPEVTITGLSQLWKDLSFPSKYDLIIPESIEGYPVTVIGDNAFQSKSDLLSIVIPNGIKSIGSYAFAYCYKLASINIPDKVTYIGSYAFSYCQSLKTITIPNGTAKLESGVFDKCSGLTNIILPDNLETIDYYLFNGCTSLVNISIPNTVEYIGYGAFESCTNLASVAIPNNLNYIDAVAFKNCPALTYFTIESNSHFSVIDGVLYDKNVNTLINYPNGKTGSFSIPESVTKVGQASFAYSGGLTSISIPNSVVTIEANAFEYCKLLTSVTIPSSVKTISSYAFSNNTGLTSVIMNPIVPPTTQQPFYNCKNLKVIKVPGNSLEFYKQTERWSVYKDIFEVQ